MTVHQDSPISSIKTGGGNHSAEAMPMGEGAALAALDMSEAAVKKGKAAIKGAKAGSNQWFGWAQDAYQVNAKACAALVGCRSPMDAMVIQGRFVEDHMKLLMDNGRRMAKATWKADLKEQQDHAPSL